MQTNEPTAEPTGLPDERQVFLTTGQAAALMGISKLTLERLRRKGGREAPPHMLIGGSIRYVKPQLIAWGERAAAPPPARRGRPRKSK